MQDKFSHISFRNMVISLAVVAGLLFIVSVYAESVLRISVTPDEPPFVVNRKMRLLTAYLEQKMGMKVEFRPMRSGDALVESLLFKELDLVWIDGAHLARARSLSNDGVMPIVQRVEDLPASPVSADATPDLAYSWSVRAGLDAELRRKLTDAFLTMHTDRDKGMGIIVYQRTTRFVPARAAGGRTNDVGLDKSVTGRTVSGLPMSR